VIATWKMARLLGGASLLAGCAPTEPVYVYYPVRPVYRHVYVSRPPVDNPDDDAPQLPVAQPKPEPSPGPDKSWSDWSPIPPAKASPAPVPPQPPSPPPLVGADPSCGWWRLCNLWENANEQ
jgi:hypothetical protein